MKNGVRERFGRRSREYFVQSFLNIVGAAYRRLLLLLKHLPVSLAIGIKAIVFPSFPSGFQLGRSDIPVRAAFLQHSTQVFPKLFDGRSGKKPVAIVDFEYDETAASLTEEGSSGRHIAYEEYGSPSFRIGP